MLTGSCCCGPSASSWWPHVRCRNRVAVPTVQTRPMRALYGSSSTRAVLLNSLKKKYISSFNFWADGMTAAPANCGSGEEQAQFLFNRQVVRLLKIQPL